LAAGLLAAMGMAMVQTASASVPFRGRGSGDVISAQPVGNLILMTAMGTGDATHLGHFTRIENIWLDPAAHTLTGDVTFIAANGDQLTVDFSAGFTSDTTAAGTYTITGGSGRFANATGSAAFGIALTSPTHFNFEFGGTMEF
jgi:hypothetical protein